MREVFNQELDTIADRLVEMSRLVTEQISRATRALETNDLELAEQVISADARIDAGQADLDRLSVQVLALQAPVAQDLRVVVSALKMSVAIERMGDLARHIAAQVRIRYPQSAVPEPFREVFSRMGEAAVRIGTAQIQLLDNPGLAAVPMIATIDEQLDALHLQVFTIIGELSSGDLTPSQIADATLVSRYFERFGDQAVNVSHKVEYLLTGSWEPDLSAP
ncbi:phosphate signaling complex protein PhoU [Brevibacterium sp. 91QC2O2]|uniref:phosphate signaling complex protein PhoU n=1 Tax=Brevibacterium sp. 91QC2O2 TaxID=2968458 RepID=UPI00211C81D4|nr:phosphate signaling complex protein PhoU [Brevibacterium sp. 91QC2O2]MCQ9368938.1 phosphate signaling complex protein PhoU [Brevibacterium sp. 91QC2O2]